MGGGGAPGCLWRLISGVSVEFLFIRFFFFFWSRDYGCIVRRSASSVAHRFFRRAWWLFSRVCLCFQRRSADANARWHLLTMAEIFFLFFFSPQKQKSASSRKRQQMLAVQAVTGNPTRESSALRKTTSESLT